MDEKRSGWDLNFPWLLGALAGGGLLVTFVLIVTSAATEELRPPAVPTPMLRTIEHDGHRFVAGERGGIAHHPDCPCVKAK